MEHEKMYYQLVESGKPEKMQLLGSVFLWLMDRTRQSNPSIYNEAVEKMNAANWCNYLTEKEASCIVAGLEHQDGSKGAKWSLTQVLNAVEKIGGAVECAPYYNQYALYVAINMIYSDFAKTLAEYIDADKMFEVVYRLAVAKLKDADRPRFIRKYFDV